MSTLILLALVGAALWFWIDTLGAREQALRAASNLCAQVDVQFLDQTVALSRLGLGRDSRGRLQVRRTYGFEFSTDGVSRRKGSAVTLGRLIESVQLDHPDGRIIQSRTAG